MPNKRSVIYVQIIEIHSFCAIAGLNIMRRDEGQRGEEIWLVGEIMEHQIQWTKDGLASRQRELAEVESQHATFPLTVDALPLHAIALANAAVFHSICPWLISPACLPPSLWEQAHVSGRDGPVTGDHMDTMEERSSSAQKVRSCQGFSSLANTLVFNSFVYYSSIFLCIFVYS